MTLEVVVVITVCVVEVLMVDTIEVVADVVTVETTVEVDVPVSNPPKGENRSIADNSPFGIV